MKKSLIALAVMGASTLAFAASNVTLYGVIEEGVLVQKAKHNDTTVSLQSGFDSGSRWGIKGVEELGNGYSVGFILEQGFTVDNGNVANTDSATTSGFTREAYMYVTGGFGKFGAGRTGTLSSGTGNNNILTGWAIGTGFGLSSWTSAIGTSFSRANNAIAYQTPFFGGFQLTAMYSNGMGDDTAKWSSNKHYYGLGALYNANSIRSSLIFEAVDNKAAVDKKKPQYVINFGFEYDLGSVTPMFAYQWANQDGGKKTNMFGLSAKVAAGGGNALIGARYLFGDDESITTGEDKVRSWNIGAAYIYPLSKRTDLKAYAGYADSSKAWKDAYLSAKGEVTPIYNGYQLFLGMKHSF